MIRSAFALFGQQPTLSPLTVLLKARPAEVRDFRAGTLASDRVHDFTEQLRVAPAFRCEPGA